MALVSATLAPVALVGGWSLAAARQPASYDPVRDTISALAAVGAADRWVMTAGFVVLGVCHVVTALALRGARPAGRVVLGVGGVAVLGVAVAAEPAAAHVPLATASFVALTLWVGLAGLPTRRTGWTVAAVLGALLVWFGVELGGPRTGLAERVVAAAQALVPLLVVVRDARAPAVGDRS